MGSNYYRDRKGKPRRCSGGRASHRVLRAGRTPFRRGAGGIKDVKLGDVVASTKVYGYESGKADTEFLPRPEVAWSSYRLEQLAKAESREREWIIRIGQPVPKALPRAYVGPIAAGEKVISSKKSDVYKFLKRQYSDALAMEMEGHGFLQSVRANAGVDALVIRGISDLVEKKRSSDAAGWQDHAARHAAAFAFQLLARLTIATARSDRSLWKLTLDATLDKVGKEKAETIIAQLSSFSKSLKLKLVAVDPGSVVLTIESSREDFEVVSALIQSRRLTDIDGIRIISISLADGDEANRQPHPNMAPAEPIVPNVEKPTARVGVEPRRPSAASPIKIKPLGGRIIVRRQEAQVATAGRRRQE